MTFFEKAIMQAIKAHNNEREGMSEYNKGIKFMSMGLYNKANIENFVICYSGEGLTRYEARCKFRPAVKGDNNVVKYQVNVYSNGEIGIYFDGTTYTA